MRNFNLFLLVGLLLVEPASAQPVPPGLKGRTYEIWDCSLGRTHAPTKSGNLSASQAKKLARAYAKVNGIDLTKFVLATVCFDANKSNPFWIVSFDGVVAAPGNEFNVRVNDLDRAAEIFWGK